MPPHSSSPHPDVSRTAAVPPDDTEYLGQSHPPKPHFTSQHKKSRKKLWISLIVVIVLLGGGAAAFLMLHKPAAKPVATPLVAKAAQPANPSVTSHGSSNTFKSTTLNVGVTYPNTWNLRESADKQEVILTSPQTTYVQKSGTTAKGVFTLKLRNGIIPEAVKTTVQNATAVADSQAIAYSQPTSDQRQYTNLSYGGADANNFSFVIVSGYTAYKAGQNFGGGVALDGQAYMFAGGFGTDANDTLAFDAVPKADFDTATFEQAVKIFESLQLY